MSITLKHDNGQLTEISVHTSGYKAPPVKAEVINFGDFEIFRVTQEGEPKLVVFLKPGTVQTCVTKAAAEPARCTCCGTKLA